MDQQIDKDYFIRQQNQNAIGVQKENLEGLLEKMVFLIALRRFVR
jgi:hypothetical protein